MAEGWEYARLSHLTYHITEHKLDFSRRRRWIRKLINTKPGERAVFRYVILLSLSSVVDLHCFCFQFQGQEGTYEEEEV